MKSSLFCLCSLLLFSLTACQTESDPEPESRMLSEEEAVDIVSGALTTDTEGLTREALEATYVADEYAEKSGGSPCGMVFDSAVDHSVNNPHVTASYSSNWSWEVLCNDLEIPVTLLYDRSTTGMYQTNRLESDDTASGDWQVDNLFGGNPYSIHGTYQRSGTQESLVLNQNAISSEVLIEVEDLIIDKDDKRIESGLASFTLSGSIDGGESFTIEGNIVFLGDMAANIIINGNVYSIQL